MLYKVLCGIEKPSTYATLVAVDFTNVFDRINHNIAVTKTISSEVRPSIIPTISSFLTNRTQCVNPSSTEGGGGWLPPPPKEFFFFCSIKTQKKLTLGFFLYL